MPRARIVCAGWLDGEGEHYPFGKVLGYTDTPDGRDSHGICVDCFRRHLTAAGYTQDQIEETLRDAGYTD